MIYVLLALIFLALGFIALNGNRQWDLTQHRTNSLSAYSKSIVKQIDAPTTIYAFAKNTPQLRQAISRALAPYLRENANFSLMFKHPDTALGLVKKFGVQREGALVISQQKRFSPVNGLTESAITKGLQAIQRIRPLTIGFAYGHGERYPEHQADFHYAQFGKALQDAGLASVSVDLSTNTTIPDNIDVLVLADPRVDYANSVKKQINQFLIAGKNLLVLAERESVRNLRHLLDDLPLPLAEGVVTNSSGAAYGIADSNISIIKPTKQEATFPPLSDLPAVLLFSQATVLSDVTKDKQVSKNDWAWYPVLSHAENTLVMSEGNASQRDDARVAMEASRLIKETNRNVRQRVIVVADADFLSNRFLGNGANREFGVRLLTFLARPAYDLTLQQTAPDRYINLTDVQQDTLTRVLVIFIPLCLALIGLIVGRIFRTRYRE